MVQMRKATEKLPYKYIIIALIAVLLIVFALEISGIVKTGVLSSIFNR